MGDKVVEHNCQWIVGFHIELGEDGDPVFCDKIAAIKHWGYWYCAEHYDLIGRIEVWGASELDKRAIP